jgi:hypothetical protein
MDNEKKTILKNTEGELGGSSFYIKIIILHRTKGEIICQWQHEDRK